MNAQALLAKLKQYPLAVAGTVIALIFLVLLYFSSSTVSDLEGRYTEIETELNTILKNNENAVGLEQELTEANKLVEELDERLMLDDAKADHYQYFLGIAETSGVSISDPVYGGYLNPDEKGVKVDTKEFAQIEYSLDISGEYQQVLDFLYGLRTGKYFIRESRLALSTRQDANGPVVEAEMVVKILSKKKEVKKTDA